MRYHPQWKWVKANIEKGKLGKINSISVSFNFFNNAPKNIRKNLQLLGLKKNS